MSSSLVAHWSPTSPRHVVRGAVLVLIASAFLATPAHAVMSLAVQDDGAFLYQHTGNRDQAFDLIAPLRPQHLRVIVYWNDIAAGQATQRRVPRNRTYDFARLDSLAEAADARGMMAAIDEGTYTPN